ncbi:MAG: bifunctional adenosylcobinamide kinase/adenosylcobinamide-phosphate guanylyltransferase [Caulobacter sp.]|nr:bifunctional adenosylcobinamide kinase/adenosylcobinamide-phosphate guanylyltransferase [Caulobacter sp.]
MTLTLVLGGARSGKSAHAQAAAEGAALLGQPVMIATGQAFDAEMAERIARHRAERAPGWRTIEAPLDLAGALDQLHEDDVAVVDCLTLWLTNVMLRDRDPEAEGDALLDALRACPADLWLVSNEVGWGVVPDNALARRFRDEAGRLHQKIAALADKVVLVVAGQALRLKPPA